MKTLGSKYLTIIILVIALSAMISGTANAQADTLRTMKYRTGSPEEALKWQHDLRASLFTMLKLNELLQDSNSNPLNPVEINTEDKGDYMLKEIEINSTPGRKIRVFMTVPEESAAPWPAVVCIHGHGGQALSVYDKNTLYNGFAHDLASSNYVTIAGFVSQHEVYEDNMILMGERLWDLMRCVDYLESLTIVDKNRIACAGLSLGGEMAMWLGGMDTRIKATISSGFLTNMDHMEQNHCMCWKFPGLRTLVDYADIYALTAPRPLMCQNGLKEPPSQFYVPLAREALKEIKPIYADLGKPENIELLVHDEGHVVDVSSLVIFLNKHLTAIGL